jgi:hypothetical protein
MRNPLRLLRRFARVPAGTRARPWPDAEDYIKRDRPDDGGTPVREPRRPKPQPVTGAGAAPIPGSPQSVDDPA